MLYTPPPHSKKTGIRIALGAAIVVVCYQLYALAFQIYKDSQIDIQYQAILSENASLMQEKQELEQLINYLQTPGYRELEQKKIANLVLPGEKTLILERPAGESPAQTPLDETVEPEDLAWEQLSNPDRWWQYLFGMDDLVQRPVDDTIVPEA